MAAGLAPHNAPKFTDTSEGNTSMGTTEGRTQISADGLRYIKRDKTTSSFGGSSGSPTTSCFKCGVHKSPAGGSYKRVIGQSVFVCHDCQAEAAAKRAAAR